MRIYVHDYGLIGKYAIIDDGNDNGMSLNFQDIPKVIAKLAIIYNKFKNYKPPDPEAYLATLESEEEDK